MLARSPAGPLLFGRRHATPPPITPTRRPPVNAISLSTALTSITVAGEGGRITAEGRVPHHHPGLSTSAYASAPSEESWLHEHSRHHPATREAAGATASSRSTGVGGSRTGRNPLHRQGRRSGLDTAAALPPTPVRATAADPPRRLGRPGARGRLVHPGLGPTEPPAEPRVQSPHRSGSSPPGASTRQPGPRRRDRVHRPAPRPVPRASRNSYPPAPPLPRRPNRSTRAPRHVPGPHGR